MLFEIPMTLVAALVLGLATATVWSRKKTRVRAAAVAAFILILPSIAATGFFALGQPAPWLNRMFVPSGRHTVLGVKMIQDEAIFLLLDMPDGTPRLYRLPWSSKLADKIQRLMRRQQRGRGGFVAIVRPRGHQVQEGMQVEAKRRPAPRPGKKDDAPIIVR